MTCARPWVGEALLRDFVSRNASMTNDVYYTQLIIPRKIRTITIDHLPDINLN